MINQEKRKTLKALTVGVAGLVAAASTTAGWAALNNTNDSTDRLGVCSVQIKHQWSTGQKRLVINNATNEDIVIDSILPHRIDNGDFVVEITAPQDQFEIPADSKLELNVIARATNEHDSLRTPWVVDSIMENLQINSSHPALAGMKPVAVFDPYMV